MFCGLLFTKVQMTLDGQTAEFLAKVQYRYAFEQNDARAASWNYQVDAYNIYQMF